MSAIIQKWQMNQPLTVAVAPTSTNIGPSLNCPAWVERLVVSITNNDATQLLDAHWKARMQTGTGGWSTHAGTDLEGIQPGETRIASFDVRGLTEVQVFGEANGAGLECTTMLYTQGGY